MEKRLFSDLMQTIDLDNFQGESKLIKMHEVEKSLKV